MKASDIFVELKRCHNANIAIMLLGPFGIGKSSVLQQYAKSIGYSFHDIRAMLLDPVDLRGIPVPNHEKRVTEWFPPAFLPTEPKSIICFDELPNCSVLVQNALYQLFHT